ncbi:MAG TPA: hypothetical protein PK416_03035 [Thermodesulfobacteriota bacterium]|nr:hypothetical protein [Thermodesulfobacteriota bacterium]
MSEWWVGFCWGIGAGVAADLAAVGLFILWAMFDERRSIKRSEDRIRIKG